MIFFDGGITVTSVKLLCRRAALDPLAQLCKLLRAGCASVSRSLKCFLIFFRLAFTHNFLTRCFHARRDNDSDSCSKFVSLRMPAAQMTAISARIVDDDSFQSFASIAKVGEELFNMKESNA